MRQPIYEGPVSFGQPKPFWQLGENLITRRNVFGAELANLRNQAGSFIIEISRKGAASAAIGVNRAVGACRGFTLKVRSAPLLQSACGGSSRASSPTEPARHAPAILFVVCAESPHESKLFPSQDIDFVDQEERAVSASVFLWRIT